MTPLQYAWKARQLFGGRGVSFDDDGGRYVLVSGCYRKVDSFPTRKEAIGAHALNAAYCMRRCDFGHDHRVYDLDNLKKGPVHE